MCKGLCNLEIVAFKLLEECIPPMSLQVVYRFFMGQKSLAPIWLDMNYRRRCHCEKDTTYTTRDRFGFPMDEKQREV
jgi:hypothetical protein